MNKHIVMIFFLLLVASCRKKTDDTLPAVQFISPATNSNHQVLEPVSFTIKATDETKLEQISVHLLDAQYNPVASSVTFVCQDNDETFSSFILPSDIHLSSGTYYLKAVAKDGFNEKTAYKEITLTEVPRSLHSIWIATQPNGSAVAIDSLNVNSFVNVYSFNSDFNGFKINSYYGLLTAIGANTGVTRVFENGSLNSLFTIQNNGNGNYPFFTSIVTENDKIFIAERSGMIRSFRKSSQPADIINTGNYFAESMCLQNDLIYTAAINSIGSQRSIQSFYLASGILAKSIVSTIEVKNMFPVATGEILLFGNESGGGKVKLYNYTTNNISEPVIFTSGIIYAVVALQNNSFLIAHSNGIDSYDYSSGIINPLLSGNAFQMVRYDDLSEVLYAAHGNQLSTYTLSPLNLIQNFTASDSIVGLDLLYNK